MKRPSDFSRIRQLIWVYFWLLLFEGALRKWVLPSAANLLLLARDPVVMAAYVLAWRARLFPRNNFVLMAGLLALMTVFASFFAQDGNWVVTIYGFRTNFLQLPFIFLIPRVFNTRDVDRIGYYVLLLSIPIALLMAFQFRSDPGAWINSGVEANFDQIVSSGNHIRPPGPFSFITGPVLFFTLSSAFLLNSQFVSKRYPVWLLAGALLALVMAASVSGSRSFVSGIAIVFFFAMIYGLLKLQLKARLLTSALVLVILGVGLGKTPVFQEGITVFAARLQNSSRAEGGTSGFTRRIFEGLFGFIPTMAKTPAFGQGLGVGTTGGAALLTGKPQFMLSEGELERIVMESGPALGLGFILYRLTLMLWLGFIVLKQTAQRDPLPFLLFGCCFLNLLNGQFGQPTLLGFTIFTCGLCLAATRSAPREMAPLAPRARQKRAMTSSAYAALPRRQ